MPTPSLIRPHDVILFQGDSITDCGRAQPVGEGLFDATGKGYVTMAGDVASEADVERLLAGLR